MRCFLELLRNLNAVHDFRSNITGGSQMFAKTLAESQEIMEHLVKSCRIVLEQHNLPKFSQNYCGRFLLMRTTAGKGLQLLRSNLTSTPASSQTLSPPRPSRPQGQSSLC
jgi:hypothetical protein